MEAKERDRRKRLPIACAECGDELVLTPSGHYLCVNRLCKDGFDVKLNWQLSTLLDL